MYVLVTPTSLVRYEHTRTGRKCKKVNWGLDYIPKTVNHVVERILIKALVLKIHI